MPETALYASLLIDAHNRLTDKAWKDGQHIYAAILYWLVPVKKFKYRLFNEANRYPRHATRPSIIRSKPVAPLFQRTHQLYRIFTGLDRGCL